MWKKTLIVPFMVLATATLLLFLIRGSWAFWEGSGSEQKTDDATVRADVTPISTRVSGTVRKIFVHDFESVRAGQAILELDDADYRATLAEAEAALAGARAGLAENQAAKKVEDFKVETARATIDQSLAAVSAAKAGITAVEPDVQRTDLEQRRQAALLASRAATRQQMEQATADSVRFAALRESRFADLQRAEAALRSSRSLLQAEQQERSALDTRDAQYGAAIKGKQAAIIVAQVNLSYAKVFAPASGAVGERHVQEGQLVSPGMQLVDLVEGHTWVQANFKETQLTNIRPGDDADVRVDIFPGVVLHGRVAEIAPASGSQFAILPPDNATGNYTRIVQRVPVKVVLDPGNVLLARLRPGFSAMVTVHPSGKSTNVGEQQR